MRIWVRLAFAVVVFGQTANVCLADPKAPVTHAVDHDSLWTDIETSYRDVIKLVESESRIYSVGKLLARKCENAQLVASDLSDFLKQEAKYWNDNYGIELRGGITSGNLDPVGNTFLELSWDVLANGYLENDFRSKDLHRRAMLEKLKSTLENQAIQFQCRQQSIRRNFDNIEFQLTNRYLKLMEAVYQIEQRAYFSGDSLFDEFLISEEAIVQARSALKRMTLDGPSDYQEAINPPLIDLDIKAILEKVVADDRFSELRRLEREGVVNDNPYRDRQRLRLFVRKEFDVLANNQDSLVAGLRFAVPLSLTERASNEFKLNQLEKEGALGDWERVTRVKQAYLNLVDQIERTTTVHYRYLRSKERVRRTLGMRLTEEQVNITAITARVKTYLESAIELVQAKANVYERVNNLFLTARLEFSPEYLKNMNLLTDPRRRHGERAVYVWSKSFNQLSNEQLFALAETKGFDSFVVSWSKKTDETKLDNFIEAADHRGVRVELIVGSNQWVMPDKHSQASTAVLKAMSKHEQLHLDIEPQTFDDYATHKEQYQRNYVTLLDTIDAVAPDTELSVSIPFHWDIDTYRSISPLADKFYVMLYETDKLDVLVRRTKRILNVIPINKVVIALRPVDFANDYELEQAIKHISQATGIEQFAIHKLGNYVEEDE